MAINLVQRDRKASTERALFLERKVSAPPVTTPRIFLAAFLQQDHDDDGNGKEQQHNAQDDLNRVHVLLIPPKSVPRG